ncbi:MAG: quinone methyltransferase, partial [Myxococcales bacterium]|nr:quinone methyltransferase [Myxococcales bacterium]
MTMDSAQPYSIRYHENNQEVALEGSLRPQGHADLEPVRECLNLAAAAVRGTLYLNLKRLRYLNHLGFLELARFLARCQRDYPDLRLKLVISSAVPWAPIRFGQLTELFPNAIVEQYDKA